MKLLVTSLVFRFFVPYRWVFFTIVLFGAGMVVGFFVAHQTHHCNCPKDLTRALQGCDHAASTLNKQLFLTQWELDSCDEALEQSNIILKQIVLPRLLERETDAQDVVESF